MAGRKNFVSGSILTASDVNSFLMDQSVMVFDDSAARGSAIPTPTEGMVTYRKDEDLVEVFNGSAFGPIGKILQVAAGVRTNEISTTATSFSVITGLTVTLTPKSASSKFIILGQLSVSANFNNGSAFFRIRRNTTDTIFIGDSSGSRARVTVATGLSNDEASTAIPIMFLDSPATTAPVTYDFSFASATAGVSVFVNRRKSATDADGREVSTSSIIVMEVAG